MTQVGPSTPNSLQHAVFATVGFGDIVAQTNDMRMLVTVQMLLNLAVPGIDDQTAHHGSATRRRPARIVGLPGRRQPRVAEWPTFVARSHRESGLSSIVPLRPHISYDTGDRLTRAARPWRARLLSRW